jgi:hypothetical protein
MPASWQQQGTALREQLPVFKIENSAGRYVLQGREINEKRNGMGGWTHDEVTESYDHSVPPVIRL